MNFISAILRFIPARRPFITVLITVIAFICQLIIIFSNVFRKNKTSKLINTIKYIPPIVFAIDIIQLLYYLDGNLFLYGTEELKRISINFLAIVVYCIFITIILKAFLREKTSKLINIIKYTLRCTIILSVIQLFYYTYIIYINHIYVLIFAVFVIIMIFLFIVSIIQSIGTKSIIEENMVKKKQTIIGIFILLGLGFLSYIFIGSITTNDCVYNCVSSYCSSSFICSDDCGPKSSSKCTFSIGKFKIIRTYRPYKPELIKTQLSFPIKSKF